MADRPALVEDVEITPAMVAAGVAAFRDFMGDELPAPMHDADDLAVAVYQAMRAAASSSR